MSLYNLRNPAVKRLMKEAEELFHPTEEYHAQPLEDNLFEWHFSIRGPSNSEFEGGIYHGRITLPPDYPMKPPSIILLTPNGRFETNKKICLSISGYHPESWQPSWSIRTALLAIIGFMPTHGNGALGSLDYTPEERKILAVKSQEFKCHECGYIKEIFLKKKLSEQLKDAVVPKLPSNIVNKINKMSIASPGRTCNESASEDCDVGENSDIINKESLLVHRNKTSESAALMPDETSYIERISDNVEKNVDLKVIASVTRQNVLHFVLVLFIVFILLFLFFRRIFSM